MFKDTHSTPSIMDLSTQVATHNTIPLQRIHISQCICRNSIGQSIFVRVDSVTREIPKWSVLREP